MANWQKWFIWQGFVNQLIAVLLLECVLIPRDAATPHFEWELIVLFGLTVGWGWTSIILTIRDLYARDFPHPNDKLTWCLLIMLTGGIGWIVYLFQYAMKPRPETIDAKLN